MNTVYIIIVNYRKFDDTIECLESILKSSYPDFQILVIDNSPDDQSIQHILNWLKYDGYEGLNTNFEDLVFPLVHKPLDYRLVTELEFAATSELYANKIVIIQAKNNGFAAANNVALKYVLVNGADSSLIWLLNNDTVIEKNTLGSLVEFYQKNKNKHLLLSSMLRSYAMPDFIQAVAGKYNKWLGKHAHVGSGERDLGQYKNYRFEEMDYIVGASTFLPKLFLDKVGLMCEDYFLYFEELDWISEGKKYGFEIALVPDAIVYHKEGSSTIEVISGNKDTSVAEFYSITSRVKFIRKWYPICLPTVMMGVTFALLKRLLIGKFSLFKKTSIAVIKILSTNNRSLRDNENKD